MLNRISFLAFCSRLVRSLDYSLSLPIVRKEMKICERKKQWIQFLMKLNYVEHNKWREMKKKHTAKLSQRILLMQSSAMRDEGENTR